jgi:hypothetical protein
MRTSSLDYYYMGCAGRTLGPQGPAVVRGSVAGPANAPPFKNFMGPSADAMPSMDLAST